MAGLQMPEEVRKSYREIENQTRLTELLAVLRQTAGITQEEMGKDLGCTQGAVSKLEAGSDDEVTIGQIKQYSRVIGERISITFGKPMNHVEAVKACALGIKHHLSELAKIAHQDEQLETAIQGFFGEAFFNLLTILAKCQGEMPNNVDFQVRLQTSGMKALQRSRAKKAASVEAACGEVIPA
jgi:transcriptional regulator with XRE-family HTH domain